MRRWGRGRLSAILVAVVAASIHAQPAPTARLAGRIVDATDGRQPVRRAIVTITGNRLPAGRSAVSDDDGRFVFERVPAGDVVLSSTRPGFMKAAYGALRPGRPGTPIAVRGGADLLDLVLTMTRGSAVDGVLRDVAGDPAPGMRVEAIRVQHRSDGDHGETAGVALTDDRGEYRIFGLLAGDYVLVATPAAILAGIGDIGAPSEAEVDAILASLPRRPASPAAPGQRPATPPPGPASAPAPSPAKAYSLPATFYPGVLQSGDATRITLGPGDAREGLDFGVRLSHSAAIDGVIVPVRGQAVPQVQVSIRGAGSDLPVFGGSAGGPTLSMRPAEHTFHVSNVPPGKYRITARTFGAPGSSTTVISGGGALPKTDPTAEVQWAVADVDMGGDDIGGLTLALQPALHVTGRIAFEATANRAPSDASAVRVALEPVADAENGANGLTSPIPGIVRADGEFEFAAVIPGTYRVTASVAGGWWLRSAVIDARDVLDGGLRVGSSSVSGIVVTLSDRHAAIAGTLSGTGGQPAPAYYMVAFSTDRAMWRAPSRRVVSTRPATDGTFELRDLPAGAYYLAALTDMEPADLEDPAFLAALVPSAITIPLAEGERKKQDVRIGG